MPARKNLTAAEEKGLDPTVEITAGQSSVVDAGWVQDRMYHLIESTLQLKKVAVPPQLKALRFTPCDACQRCNPEDYCDACTANSEALDAFREFGGIYKADWPSAVKALHLTGRDFGLYYEKKLIGALEGEKAIDESTTEEVRQFVRSLCSQVGLRVVEARSYDEEREYFFDRAPELDLRITDLKDGREEALRADAEQDSDLPSVS